MSILTPIPIPELKGRLFRSPMPFSAYDKTYKALAEMKAQAISVLVMLVSDQEALLQSGKRLHSLYQLEGIQVISLPIPDFGVPDRADLDQVIQQTLDLAQAGHNIAVHCLGGCGRSGLFLVELVKAARQMSPQLALDYVRLYLPCAVETQAQLDYIFKSQQAAQ